ncbi:right-handed parallel beta-helix repeat-containing protein [Treponema primitia]|uniref:right-handed parallel beta-helix repeat-containing protein n=1 Tax=Treponema primitia TaxID=88058 RepID=UPI00397F8348
MKRIGFLIMFAFVLQSLAIVSVFSQEVNRSYYVRADGDDTNNGRTEDASLKTVQKAFELASRGAVKTITVIGKISGEITIGNSGNTEIVLQGKAGSTDSERGILSGLWLEQCNVKILNLEISDGSTGLYIVGGTVVLGQGTKICNNSSGGIYIRFGTLTLDGAEISNNSITNSAGGGIKLADNSKLLMISGTITGNRSTGDASYSRGGGIDASSSGVVFEMRGGTISDNVSGTQGGGIYSSSGFTMSGGEIINNSAKAGGGIYIGGGGIVTIKAGTIKGNKAEYGAGIYVRTAEKTGCTIDGGTITENIADFVGGGIYLVGGSVYKKNGGTISKNQAGDGEGEDIFTQR